MMRWFDIKSDLHQWWASSTDLQFDGSVQERRNSSALAMELGLSCINPSSYVWLDFMVWQ